MTSKKNLIKVHYRKLLEIEENKQNCGHAINKIKQEIDVKFMKVTLNLQDIYKEGKNKNIFSI